MEFTLYVNGEYIGPLKAEEITQALKEGKLSVSDYLYSNQSSKWQHIGEIDLFSAFVPPKQNPVIERSFIYIQKNGRSLGPYSKADIYYKIHTSELLPFDYVLLEGLDEWIHLKDIPEYGKFFQKVKEGLEHPDKTLEASLEDIDEIRQFSTPEVSPLSAMNQVSENDASTPPLPDVPLVSDEPEAPVSEKLDLSDNDVSWDVDEQAVANPAPSELETPELETPELETPELETPELENPELETLEQDSIDLDLSGSDIAQTSQEDQIDLAEIKNPILLKALGHASIDQEQEQDLSEQTLDPDKTGEIELELENGPSDPTKNKPEELVAVDTFNGDQFEIRNDSIWLIDSEEGETGPYTFLQVMTYVQAGKVSKKTLIKKIFDDSWRRMGEIYEFNTNVIKKVVTVNGEQVEKFFGRRRYPRASYMSPAIVRKEGTEIKGKCTIIGQGGCFIACNVLNLVEGEEIRLNIVPDDFMPLQIVTQARIVSILEGQRIGINCEFLNLETSKQHEIKTYVEQFLAQLRR